MAKIKYKTIPPDAIIDIQVSGSYYIRIVEILTHLSGSMPLDDFRKVADKLKTNEQPANFMELQILMSLMLILEIEQQAHKQNKVVEKESDVPDEEKPVETTTGN